MSRIDPVTLELIRNAILATSEEMRFIVMRSARAPLLKEAGDLSCVLTDAQGRVIAQGQDTPVHLGVMAFTVKEFLKVVSREDLRPGDVYLTNLPEIGGNHLPDVKAIRPVFYDGALSAFAVCLAHWPDTGGALPGSYVPDATETYQEGLRIPPVKIFVADRPIRETLDFILENVRNREEREGDILGQYAGQTVAESRLFDIFGQWGRATTLAAFERMQEESETRMRREIAAIPNGVYEAEEFMDSMEEGGEPLPIRLAIRIEGDRAAFDFTGTAPPVPFPINTTPFIAAASVFYSMRVLVGRGIPMNDGCCRPLAVHAPGNTLLNPGREAPRVGGNHETSQVIVDAVFRALAPVLPDRITAGGPATSGLTLFSGKKADGTTFILYEVHGGGAGAAAHRDGSNATRERGGRAETGGPRHPAALPDAGLRGARHDHARKAAGPPLGRVRRRDGPDVPRHPEPRPRRAADPRKGKPPAHRGGCHSDGELRRRGIRTAGGEGGLAPEGMTNDRT